MTGSEKKSTKGSQQKTQKETSSHGHSCQDQNGWRGKATTEKLSVLIRMVTRNEPRDNREKEHETSLWNVQDGRVAVAVQKHQKVCGVKRTCRRRTMRCQVAIYPISEAYSSCASSMCTRDQTLSQGKRFKRRNTISDVETGSIEAFIAVHVRVRSSHASQAGLVSLLRTRSPCNCAGVRVNKSHSFTFSR